MNKDGMLNSNVGEIILYQPDGFSYRKICDNLNGRQNIIYIRNEVNINQK